MSGVDLALLAAREELYAEAKTTRAYVDYASANALDPWAISPYAGATARLPIKDCGGGRFDFAGVHEAIDGFIIEALGEDGETTVDLVAWPVHAPERPLSMFGRVGFLNTWAVFNSASYYLGKSLAVHRTPLAWLQAGAAGTAIVDPSIAARQMLDVPGTLAARDPRHAAELRRIAQRVLRRVVVITGEAAA